MEQTRSIMGMPITVKIVDSNVSNKLFDEVFAYFVSIDTRFSTYKENSEITKINNGLLKQSHYSQDMKTVLSLSEQTKQETNGYFDINHNGIIDPSGLVKGWAIYQASLLLKKRGVKNFYIDAGGDIQVSGRNEKGQNWSVGIRNPFSLDKIVKKIIINTQGVATSGTYLRGQHIYNPHSDLPLTDVVSMTVIGPNVYEADRFATAAFAMGTKGIQFIESLPELEGYMIDAKGVATYTSGFQYVVSKPNEPEYDTIIHAPKKYL